MPEPHLPEFPTHLLPDWLRRFIENVAIARQVPAALPALMTMSTLGAAVAGKARVVVRPGYDEAICLWTACVLGSGERKSSVLRDATRPLEEVEAALADVWQSAAVQEGADASSLPRFEQLLAEAGEAADGMEPMGIRETITAVGSQYDQFAPGVMPELLVDNFTSAAFVEVLQRQGGRVAIMNAEGALFENIVRFARSGSADIDELLRSHVAEPIRRHRKGQNPIVIRSPHLTIGIAPQPEVLRSLRRTPALRGRGLLARFMWSVPQSQMGRRNVSPPGIEPSVIDAYHEHVWALLRLGWSGPARLRTPQPHGMMLTEGALRVRDAFAQGVEDRLAADGDLRVIADWANKAAGLVVRVAGILHLAEHALEGEGAFTKPISEQTMLAAAGIGQFAIPHALAAYDLMAGDTLDDDVVYVLAALRKTGWAEFSVSQVHKRVDGRIRRSEQVARVLEHLTTQGILRLVASRKLTRGRPLGPLYQWVTPEE